MDYAVVIHEAEEGGYWAEVPALDGCFAQAETMEDLLAETREAIVSHVRALREDGQDIPGGDTLVTVTVPDERIPA